jgi:hypothetical protein
MCVDDELPLDSRLEAALEDVRRTIARAYGGELKDLSPETTIGDLLPADELDGLDYHHDSVRDMVETLERMFGVNIEDEELGHPMDGGPTLAGWTDLVRKRLIEMEEDFIGDWSMCPYCLDQFSLPYPANSTRNVICPGCSKVLKRDQILSGELSVDDFVRMPDGKGGWELAISETEFLESTSESSQPKQSAKKKQTAPRTSRHCPKCDKKVQKTANFCFLCGWPLDNRCPSCNKKVQKVARFCYSCGHQLGS